MSKAFENNSGAGDWPDLSAEEYAEILDVVDDVQVMKGAEDEGPLPGTDS